MPLSQTVMIVLVEDDPGHARLIEKNLRRGGISNPIVRAEDGQQAIELLFEGGLEKVGTTPGRVLVLLDLNLPIIDGYEVLKRIKSTPATSRIPVVVLTTTDDDREIGKCYEMGCNVYVTKPMEYGDFTEAIRALGLLLSVVSVPQAMRI